jgi:hypothetical protein
MPLGRIAWFPFVLWVLAFTLVRPAADPRATDAGEYRAMIEQTREAEAPFAFRIGVPWLIRNVTVGTIETRFIALGLIAILATIWLQLGVLRRVGIPLEHGVLSLCLLLSTPGCLYLLENPFLTDPVWLLAQQIAIVAWLHGQAAVFVAIVTLGAAVRENALWVSLLPFLSNHGRSSPFVYSLGLAGSLAVLIAIHLLVQVESPSLWSQVLRVGTNKGWIHVAGDLAGSLHVLWIGVAYGIIAPPRTKPLNSLAATLLLPALASCVVAINTQRMLVFAFPVVSWALARAIGALKLSLSRVAGAAAVLFVGALAGVPTVVGEPSKPLRLVLMGVGAALLVSAWRRVPSDAAVRN